MISKKDLLEAWEKATKRKPDTIEELFDIFKDCFNNLPDDEPKECDVVTEHIKHGLEWAAKTVRITPEWEGRLNCILLTHSFNPHSQFSEAVKEFIREEIRKFASDIKNNVGLHDGIIDDTDMATIKALNERGIK